MRRLEGSDEDNRPEPVLLTGVSDLFDQEIAEAADLSFSQPPDVTQCFDCRRANRG